MTTFKSEGCPNLRDMGGYNGAGGQITAYNRIYRSDCLSKLTKKDIEQMEARDIRCIIDLRFSSETKRLPNPLKDRPGFYYYNISLVDGIYSNNLRAALPDSMAQMYISLVDEAYELIIQVFRIMTKHRDVNIVFHCSAGKDRTGVIAAILLLLAGVSRRDIVDNYSQTYELMKDLFQLDISRLEKEGYTVEDHVFRSNPEFINEFLDHFEKTYGSAESYLLSKGLTEEALSQVKSILIHA